MSTDVQIEFEQLSNGEVGLRSVFKKADGTPRFILPLPPQMIESDAGVRYMVVSEALHGGCEYQTRRFFDAHLGPDDLFIDVGAHWGLFTLTAAGLHPAKLSVIAIEADPFNTFRLAKSVSFNGFAGQVEIMACALGADSGIAGLIGGKGTMGGSIDGVSYGAPDSGEAPPPSYSVPVLTLDYILSKRPELARKPVFLKVDVEGLEIEVLRGAAELIASGRLKAMVIEKGHAYDREPALSGFGAMVEGLAAQGFTVYRFKGHNHPGPLIPYELSADDCDIVCVADGIKPLAEYR